MTSCRALLDAKAIMGMNIENSHIRELIKSKISETEAGSFLEHVGGDEKGILTSR